MMVKKLLQDKHPSKYMPGVGRQVMADGGVPSLDQIREMMIGTSPAVTNQPGAYTDPYGLKVSAPFVTAMRGGYPVPPAAPNPDDEEIGPTSPEYWRKVSSGFADGGPVEGEVSFLEDDKPTTPLPTFAQPETQEITKALDAARAAQPREAEMRSYDPTIRERISGFLAGTSEAKPTPERASFAKGVADILGYSPLLGQAMQAQESARAGDKKGVAMAVLPMPAGRAGAAAEEAATNIARRVTNPLGMHSEAADVARSLPQQKGTIEQMLAMMKNKVNPEELHWSEVSKAFQPGQKVTAEELAQHFESKLPQAQETVYEGVREPKYPTYVTPGGENYREVVLHHPVGKVEEPGKRMITYRVSEKTPESNPVMVTEENLQQMKEHGFLINDLGPAMKDAPAFRGSHHDEPNIFAHLRMSDMTGPGGEKILNVHELQSDWSQQARKHGVITGREAEDKAALEVKRNEFQSRISQLVNEVKQKAADRYRTANFSEPEIERLMDRMSPADIARVAGGEEMQNQYMRLIEENSQLYDDIRSIDNRKLAAPYATSREGQHNTPGWTDLLIKRILQEAEKGGYEKVVWDTPAEQGKRYGNMPKIVKGMQGYYGDVLPRRIKKVVPEAKLGEHEVGVPTPLIDADDAGNWANATMNSRTYFDAINRGMTPEQALRASGQYNDYIISLGAKNDIRPLQDLDITRSADDEFLLYRLDTGDQIGKFPSLDEAREAKKTYAADEIVKQLNPGVAKRPGFEVTPELLERIRKGLPAYRDGGEVDDALALAKSLR